VRSKGEREEERGRGGRGGEKAPLADDKKVPSLDGGLTSIKPFNLLDLCVSRGMRTYPPATFVRCCSRSALQWGREEQHFAQLAAGAQRAARQRQLAAQKETAARSEVVPPAAQDVSPSASRVCVVRA